MIEVWITVIAFVGTLVSSWRGWRISGEAWNWTKFEGSVAAGLLYALAVGVSYAVTKGSAEVPLGLNFVVAATTFLGAVGVNWYGKDLWSGLPGR